jgi:hypothetical protein
MFLRIGIASLEHARLKILLNFFLSYLYSHKMLICSCVENIGIKSRYLFAFNLRK